jgi:glucosamine--fructose-6-phosphate aminotransferase (isomerizing)
MRYHYAGYQFTEAAIQAMEYDLSDSAVFVASNSGRTKEAVALIRKLKSQGHAGICGVIANSGTPIEEESDHHFLLTCGTEKAVAATKSVVEQALFYDILFRKLNERPLPDLAGLAEAMREAMTHPIDERMAERLCDATTLYWAGRNNGVAEELTLKSNEITHKKSDYLEGSYAVHGIEEVMASTDAVLVISPFESEEEKFREVLVKGVGLPVYAIADRKRLFPTLEMQPYPDFRSYIELAAGWNILVEIGVRLGIDLDKAQRARKVGNEFVG